jgi:chromatin segregation and condensation protein Rec8/ScpA/Scc1 (kleisin family)
MREGQAASSSAGPGSLARSQRGANARCWRISSFPSRASSRDAEKAEARQAFTRLIGGQSDWTAFDDFLLQACADAGMRRSARASAFSASLELAREGKLEIRQQQAFAPLWLRARDPGPAEELAA